MHFCIGFTVTGDCISYTVWYEFSEASYGYSVSALRRNSAPEIALTFCYLVCRLQMIVAGGIRKLSTSSTNPKHY